MKDTEKLIMQALASINGVNYACATEAQKDAWLVDNADRVLFGAAIGRLHRSQRRPRAARHHRRHAHRRRHLAR